MDCKVEAFFFPSKQSELEIIKELNLAKNSIQLAIYSLTNKKLLSTILQLVFKNPNFNCQIITEHQQNQNKFQKSILQALIQLSDHQIEARVDKTSSLMHNKYAIIDEKVIITGSFNWTQKAVVVNRENILILRNVELVKKYKKDFDQMWCQFEKYKIQANEVNLGVEQATNALLKTVDKINNEEDDIYNQNQQEKEQKLLKKLEKEKLKVLKALKHFQKEDVNQSFKKNEKKEKKGRKKEQYNEVKIDMNLIEKEKVKNEQKLENIKRKKLCKKNLQQEKKIETDSEETIINEIKRGSSSDSDWACIYKEWISSDSDSSIS